MKTLVSLVSAILCLQLLLLPAAAEVPDPDDGIYAQAAVLIDADTGQVLYEKNACGRMYPASITKIMTAMLVLENLSPTDRLVAGRGAVDLPTWSSSANIEAGERLTVDEAMYALMLRSANEAANVLAEEVAGSQAEFARMMTERARQIGATGTQFTNAHGLPERSHYTTAYDMALITREALGTPGFLTYFGAGSYTMEATNKSGARIFTNTHSMVPESSWRYSEEVIGGKTGYTGQSGYTLVTVAQRHGRTLICVVLKSDNCYTDTETLLDFGFEEFLPYIYRFESSGPVEVALFDGNWEAGFVLLDHQQSAQLWIHESVDPDGITADYVYPESIQVEEELDAVVLLQSGDDLQNGLPRTLFAVPMHAAVTQYDPLVRQAVAYTDLEEVGVDSPSPLYPAVALLCISSAVVLLLFPRRGRQGRRS